MGKIARFPSTEGKLVVRTSLERGDYAGEVFRDQSIDPPIYHYIVTRRGSADILAMGQELSAAAAKQEALFVIYELLAVEVEAAKAGA